MDYNERLVCERFKLIYLRSWAISARVPGFSCPDMKCEICGEQ